MTLGKALGQTVIVDNRGGASGAIAAVAVSVRNPTATRCWCSTQATTSSPQRDQQSAQWGRKDTAVATC